MMSSSGRRGPVLRYRPMDTPGNLPDDFPEESFTIIAFCDTCDHRAPLDRARVPLGDTVQALRGRLRCSACGHRGRSIRVVYTGGATGMPSPGA